MSIGKDIYYPFSVEMHYFRIDKRYWSVCFERIKRAGFRIISTAVPWNLHQDKNKDIDFNGFQDSRKDLIVFLELAREFGFKIIMRPGPWIAGQWINGGIPDFVLNDESLLARDAQGNTVSLDEMSGVSGGKLVSYLHPHFQHFLKNYFKTLIETTKNYIHPRGPIFLVEFDYETSFCRHTGPGEADYNDYVIGTLYPSYLETRYGEIKQLNAVYRSKNKSFGDVEPPRDFSGVDLKDLPKVFDWFRFKEQYLTVFLHGLEELFKSYTVMPLFFRSLYFAPQRPLPAFALSTEDEAEHLMGASAFPDGTAFDLMQKARYMRTMTDFAWSPSFISGNTTTDRRESEMMFPITDGRRRFFVAAGLAGGFKGLNHYMFINRDHWYGAPVDHDGTIGTGFEIVKRLNIAIPQMEVNQLEAEDQLAAAFYRPYQWLSSMPKTSKLGYSSRLLDDTFNGVCRDLGRLRINHGVGDIDKPERLEKFKTIYMPVAEIMSGEAQENIIALAEKGVNIILAGLMPRYDETGRENTTLSKKLHLKTTAAAGIGEIEYGRNLTFTSHLYGTIRTTDPKISKLAISKKKAVGVVSNRFKGRVFFFSFDLASGGDFHKLLHLESILKEAKLTSPVYTSDPNVEVIIQKSEKVYVLFILAPPAGELGDATDIRSKKIMLKVDLRAIGFKGTKIKLFDQFAEESEEIKPEPIRTSVDELKSGIEMDIEFPDGKIFLIKKG
ncbi:MAG: hypothetical protein GY841_13735 [FCB group bacterium]|nr:hypothetical protein [FCB group bacterium]